MNIPKKVRHYLGRFMERKVKYDYTFKQECVSLVLKNHIQIDMFLN